MQMYLSPPGHDRRAGPVPAGSGAFDASILYHEYTHGLSNRLVVDATGNSTLNSFQAGAMGEAWSDFYAMDYLVTQGLETDTATPGEVLEGKYVAGRPTCSAPWRSTARWAPGPNCIEPDGETGGYTYGDFPTHRRHARGARLRRGLGADPVGPARALRPQRRDEPGHPRRWSCRPPTRRCSTCATRSCRPTWSSTAARTPTAVDASSPTAAWAGSPAPSTAATPPAEDFHAAAAAGPRGTSISGTVTDSTTGARCRAPWSRRRPRSGFAGDYTAVTDATALHDRRLFAGTYPKVVRAGTGLRARSSRPSRPSTRGTTANFAPRRDWAAASGGAVADFNGPDFTPSVRPRARDRPRARAPAGAAPPVTTRARRRTCSSRSRSWSSCRGGRRRRVRRRPVEHLRRRRAARRRAIPDRDLGDGTTGAAPRRTFTRGRPGPVNACSPRQPRDGVFSTCGSGCSAPRPRTSRPTARPVPSVAARSPT